MNYIMAPFMALLVCMIHFSNGTSSRPHGEVLNVVMNLKFCCNLENNVIHFSYHIHLYILVCIRAGAVSSFVVKVLKMGKC